MNEIEVFGSFSGLQINLKKQDSISVMYVFGITHELAKKVNFGRMSETLILPK
jgi:hypothetical protein